MEARIVEGLVKDQNGGRSWRKIKMATSLLGDGRWRFGVARPLSRGRGEILA